MTQKRHVLKLILVYNADSGMLAALADSARKLFRVQGCTLCSITHGVAGEKAEWRECREELGLPVEILHRDELDGKARDTVDGQLPCVLAETEEGLEMLLSPEVLERCKGSVGDFKGRLTLHASMHDLELPMTIMA